MGMSKYVPSELTKFSFVSTLDNNEDGDLDSFITLIGALPPGLKILSLILERFNWF